MHYDTIKNIFFKLDPEDAHHIAEIGLRSISKLPFGLNILKKNFTYEDKILNQNIFGLNFLNPIGIAGGFDKNATMLNPLFALGYGHIEYGTLTPKPQSGNAKPRLFRLIEEESIQNAMGFNNDGAKIIKERIEKIYPFKIPLFCNIGKNKITPNDKAIDDYVNLVKIFSDISDVFVINISSPNTPNLRNLQEESFIDDLFNAIKPLTKKPIVLKISPDMSIEKSLNLCVNAVKNGANGIILTNTTIDYSLSKNAKNFGGISGELLKEKSKTILKEIAKELFKKTILISSGGVNNANEAYERIKFGANLVQIYTAFIYKGPKICYNINSKLAKMIKDDGYENISQAVGVNLK